MTAEEMLMDLLARIDRSFRQCDSLDAVESLRAMYAQAVEDFAEERLKELRMKMSFNNQRKEKKK